MSMGPPPRRASPVGIRGSSPAARTTSPTAAGRTGATAPLRGRPATTVSPSPKAPGGSIGSGSTRTRPLSSNGTTARPAAGTRTGSATSGGGTSGLTSKRTDSPVAVPNRGDIRGKESRPPGDQRPGTIALRKGYHPSTTSNDQQRISSVPTRDAITGRQTPTRSGPGTPGRSGITNVTTVRSRSPRDTSLNLNSATSRPGAAKSDAKRVDPEWEADRRKLRLEKIQQVAKQVEAEANRQAREEARVKPDMVVAGGVDTNGGPQRDFELSKQAPHRHPTPTRPRSNSVGSTGSKTSKTSTGSTSGKGRTASPVVATTKRIFPDKLTKEEQLAEIERRKGKAAIQPKMKDTFSKDLNAWELKSNGNDIRKKSPSRINEQQNPNVKAKITGRAHVDGANGVHNPLNRRLSSSSPTAQIRPAGSPTKRDSSPSFVAAKTGKAGVGRVAQGDQKLLDHPMGTKKSQEPGYMATAPRGLSGSQAHYAHRPPSNNILGLKHTEKAGSKFVEPKAKAPGKRCASAGSKTSQGTVLHPTGNPCEMSPPPPGRPRSADRGIISPNQTTSKDNMFSKEKTPSSTAIGRSGRPISAEAALKRKSSPTLKTSDQHPMSITSRGAPPPKVSVNRLKKSVAIQKSSKGLLTEPAEGDVVVGDENSNSSSKKVGGIVQSGTGSVGGRRKYTTSSTKVKGILNWASTNTAVQ